MFTRRNLVLLCITICMFQVKCADKYTDENRPYEFGFTIDGEQHRHEKKDENGIIMGEFGFITADGVYHVTVYATDENGGFKILSMKNIRVKPYPTAKTGPERGRSLDYSSPRQIPSTYSATEQSNKQLKEPQKPGVASPTKSCSHCSIPTTTTTTTEAPYNLKNNLQQTPAISQPVMPPEYNQHQAKSNFANAQGSLHQEQHQEYLQQVVQQQGVQQGVQQQFVQQQGVQQQVVQQQGVQQQVVQQQVVQQQGVQQQVEQQQGVQQEGQLQKTLQLQELQQQELQQQRQKQEMQQQLYQYQNYAQGLESPDSKIRQQQQQQQSLQQQQQYPNQLNISPYKISSAKNNPQSGENAKNYPQQSYTQNGERNNINQQIGASQTYPENNEKSNYPGSSFGQAYPPVPSYSLGQKVQPETNRNPKSYDEQSKYDQFPQALNAISSPLNSFPQNNLPVKKPQLISAQMQIVDKNTDVHYKRPGEKDGLPEGLNKDDMSQLLYTFNYTVGFHGHFEEGYRNGAKVGYYYVTGRNGVRTRVDYVADENGFRPKITQEVLDLLSDDVPKPETEKDAKYGLKGYEFKWLYYPVDTK